MTLLRRGLNSEMRHIIGSVFGSSKQLREQPRQGSREQLCEAFATQLREELAQSREGLEVAKPAEIHLEVPLTESSLEVSAKANLVQLSLSSGSRPSVAEPLEREEFSLKPFKLLSLSKSPTPPNSAQTQPKTLFQPQPTPQSAMSDSTPNPNTKNILASDVEIKGSIKFQNDLTIDGKVEGEIVSPGTLTVGENAEIRGEIKTKGVTVYGKVHGNITVEERCELKSHAVLNGDLKATRLVIEDGATFVGKSEVTPNRIAMKSPEIVRTPEARPAIAGGNAPRV